MFDFKNTDSEISIPHRLFLVNAHLIYSWAEISSEKIEQPTSTRVTAYINNVYVCTKHAYKIEYLHVHSMVLKPNGSCVSSSEKILISSKGMPSQTWSAMFKLTKTKKKNIENQLLCKFWMVCLLKLSIQSTPSWTPFSSYTAD